MNVYLGRHIAAMEQRGAGTGRAWRQGKNSTRGRQPETEQQMLASTSRESSDANVSDERPIQWARQKNWQSYETASTHGQTLFPKPFARQASNAR